MKSAHMDSKVARRSAEPTSRVTISEASLVSLPELKRLFDRAVRDHFTYFDEPVRRRVMNEHGLRKLLFAKVDPRRVVLLARTEGRIIGYAIGAAPKTGPAQLFWLYVEPGHRGSNIGLSLLSRMLKLLGVRGARVVSIATHDHRRYYQRQGFQFLKKTKVDGVDMDILTFSIKR
jgi:ribosomal protein S18 acetylase RimI-like enzyme